MPPVPNTAMRGVVSWGARGEGGAGCCRLVGMYCGGVRCSGQLCGALCSRRTTTITTQQQQQAGAQQRLGGQGCAPLCVCLMCPQGPPRRHA